MKEPAYYKEIGYEDHGYVSPELSSSNTYPDYIKQEVTECIKEIQAHQNEDTITFAFMTDIHYALSYNHEVRMKRTVNAYKELAKRVHIDKLILGGDYTNEGCREHKSDCFRELRALLDGIDYYPVNGNHDDGTIWDSKYILNDISENHLAHTDLYNLFYNHIPYIGAKVNSKDTLYYYVDDDVKKIRYICLDSNDEPYIYENGRLLYSGQSEFILSQKQVDWLVDDALKVKSDDWCVAIFTHSVALPNEKREVCLEAFRRLRFLNGLIDAYKNADRYTYTSDEKHFENTVDVDFSEYPRAEVIGFFVGDYHTDLIDRSASGTPYILTGNAVMYCTNSPTYQQRHDVINRNYFLML